MQSRGKYPEPTWEQIFDWMSKKYLERKLIGEATKEEAYGGSFWF